MRVKSMLIRPIFKFYPSVAISNTIDIRTEWHQPSNGKESVEEELEEK